MSRREFPGFAKCMELMRQSDPQLQEDGFHWLAPRAGKFIHELIAEFRLEEDQGLKCWLLELIGASRSPEAFEILKDNLESESEALRDWAMRGLRNHDSKESRKLLFDLGK